MNADGNLQFLIDSHSLLVWQEQDLEQEQEKGRVAFARPDRYAGLVSLAEIEKAVATLSPEELTRLAAFITRQDNLTWDRQLEEDFSPGGKHAGVLEKLDAEIDTGNFTPLA